MKQVIQFQAECVVPQISVASTVVAPKNTLAILSSLRIETKSDNNGLAYMEITASDGDTWVNVKADIEPQTEIGVCFCINAKDFLQALRNLGSKRVDMKIDMEKHIAICSYAKGHFSLPIEESLNYPLPVKIDNSIHSDITPDRLLTAIEKAGFATANDELRPVMNGIHFDFTTDGMLTVATDGRKLAKYVDTTIKCVHDGDSNASVGFTLPEKPSTSLLKILGVQNSSVTISFDDHFATFFNESFYLITKLIEGRFPNYNAIIPKNNSIDVCIDKVAFTSALKRVQPMANASSNLVVMRFENGEVEISSEDYDFSKKATEYVGCDYASASPQFTIGFNGSMLMQVLGNISGDILKLSFSEPSRPALVYEGTPNNNGYNYLVLVMPMRINNL